MKPLLVMFEICGPFKLRPGRTVGPFKDSTMTRVWWLWFAIAWVRMDLYEHNRWIAGGNTEWIGE